MTVTWVILGAAVLTGFLGGVHCAGMCGGIVAAVVGQSAGNARPGLIHLAYNTGRISSYAIASVAADLSGRCPSSHAARSL